MAAKLVVDSSVVIKWFTQEEYSEVARRILKSYEDEQIALLAPDLIVSEVGNILWKKQVMQGLDEEQARLALNLFLSLEIALTPTVSLLEAAYQLAVKHRRTVYDMMFVALSQREKCKFVTADERLVNAIQPAFPDIIWIGKWM